MVIRNNNWKWEFDIKYGDRNLALASMNVTTLKKPDMIGEITS